MFWTILIIVGFILVGLVFGCLLCRINKGEDEALNRPSEAKQARKAMKIINHKVGMKKWEKW